MLEIRFTPKSLDDYLTAFNHYWDMNPAIAAAFESAERSIEDFLSEFPYAGREHICEDGHLTRYFPLSGFPYRIVYQVSNGRIIILTMSVCQDSETLERPLAPYLSE